jgi:hypothetical protein
MATQEFLPYEELMEIVLLRFYQLAMGESESGRMAPNEWKAVRPFETSLMLVQKCVNDLTDKALLDLYVYQTTRKPSYWAISDNGIKKIESRLNDPQSAASKYLKAKKIGTQGNHSTHNEAAIAVDKVAASDSTYSESISGEMADAVRELIQSALDLIPSLNLSNQQRVDIVSRLEAAAKLLNSPEPPWQTIKEILQPLAAIAGISSLILQIIQMI